MTSSKEDLWNTPARKRIRVATVLTFGGALGWLTYEHLDGNVWLTVLATIVSARLIGFPIVDNIDNALYTRARGPDT